MAGGSPHPGAASSRQLWSHRGQLAAAFLAGVLVSGLLQMLTVGWGIWSSPRPADTAGQSALPRFASEVRTWADPALPDGFPQGQTASPAQDRAGSPRPRPPASRAWTLLDLNQATAEQLQELPGIGPVLAARIVEERQSHGPFRSVSDLLRVRGIGPKTLAKVRPYVHVAEEVADRGGPAGPVP